MPLVAAAVATLIATALYAGDRKRWWTVPGLEALEHTTIGTRFRLRGERSPKSDNIVILGLDDKTRADAPEVFQTRRGWATLIDAASKYEPLALGLDLFFASPEISLAPAVVTQVRESHAQLAALDTSALTPPIVNARDALAAVVEEARGDEILAAAIARSQRIYLGIMFFFPEGDAKSLPAGIREPSGLGMARYGEAVDVKHPPSRRPPASNGVIRTMPSIGKGAVGGGSLNVLKDRDGEVRRTYGVIEHAARFYMPLGLSMALAAIDDGADSSFVVGDDHIRVGDRSVPVGLRGEIFLSYLGPRRTFPHVSAADVLSGAAPPDALAGKLVFVGYTDAARDKVTTPFDSQLDGVEIHATLAHNILHGEAMRQTSPETTLYIIFALGAIITLLQLRRVRQRRAWIAAAGALAIVASYLIYAHVMFSSGVVVEVAAPLASTLFVALASLSIGLVTEGREKAQLRTAFSQYVNDTIVDRIASDQDLATLGGVRRELTVLFSDIRGFSRFSERLEPEALSNYLNEYLTPMTELVMNENGMLDKYIGDAVMAVYGAPVDMTDHAERACRTALAMFAALGPLNKHWHDAGLPEILIGIGLNSGPMAVGNMGSEAKFDYTVMGDAVNLGARLEGLTKTYRVDILVGEGTAEAAGKGFVFREIDLVQVKGRDATARIFELVGNRGEVSLSEDDLATFADGLSAYRGRDWDGAELSFRSYLSAHPDDGPAEVMLARIANLRANPPDEGWNGTFTHQTK